jgi:4-amino-4-deoxy-L-arabinose transferase-like glycosyltransferase
MPKVAAFAWVVALALGLRLIAFVPFADAPYVYDESYYAAVAKDIALGRGHTLGLTNDATPGALRPPLFSYALAPVLALSQGNRAAARAFQVPISLAIVAGVIVVARRRFGARAAFAAGLAAAIAPPLVHYPHLLWAENLAAILLVLAFVCLERFEREPRWMLAAGAGALLGLAALTKEIWLYFVPVASLWLSWVASGSRTRRAAFALLCAGSAALTIAPWTLRNRRLLDTPVSISNNRWFPIAMGNLFAPDDWLAETPAEVRQAVIARAKQLPRDRREDFYRDLSLGLIAEQQPWWFARKALRTAQNLYVADTQPLRFLAQGWIRPSMTGSALIVATEVAGHYAFLAFGILGLWLVPGDRFKVLALAALGLLHGVHWIANAVPRFLVPVLPIFALYAGALIARPAVLREAPRWRWLGAAICLALALLLPLPRSLACIADAWRAGVAAEGRAAASASPGSGTPAPGAAPRDM